MCALWHRIRLRMKPIRKKEINCIVLLSWCTRWLEFFGQALLHVFRWEILQNVLFVLQSCS